jgi:hypothetical protein
MALQLMPPDGDGGPEMPQKPCKMLQSRVQHMSIKDATQSVTTVSNSSVANLLANTCDAVARNLPDAEEAEDVVNAICREIPAWFHVDRERLE